MEIQINYRKIDLFVACISNLINIVMSVLFIARIAGLPLLERVLGIIAMIMGFSLGYIAIINKKNKREKWEFYLLIPIVLLFIVELILDYILALEFRNTPIVGPYILLYYIGLWGLIGYNFRFDKKWGFITLATYFLNMILSIIQHF
ncbi:MAG: hypothetical protein ACFE85_14755 [Candidatus Hodarchaeota archaeon]